MTKYYCYLINEETKRDNEFANITVNNWQNCGFPTMFLVPTYIIYPTTHSGVGQKPRLSDFKSLIVFPVLLHCTFE